MLSVLEVAERYGVSRFTVQSWINSGLLTAIDVSSSGSKFRRYRITEDALKAFEAARTSGEPRRALTIARPVEKFI